jgi:hypothetical protein
MTSSHGWIRSINGVFSKWPKLMCCKHMVMDELRQGYAYFWWNGIDFPIHSLPQPCLRDGCDRVGRWLDVNKCGVDG